MFQVPEIRAPDEDEDEEASSGRRLGTMSMPGFSLQVPTDDSQPPGTGGGCGVTLQVPGMGGEMMPPASHLMPPGNPPGGRLEPPKTLPLSLPPFPQVQGIPSLLQVPVGGSFGPRRRHSWICRYELYCYCRWQVSKLMLLLISLALF